MFPTYGNSDFSEQSAVGLKRELGTLMEILKYLRYISLLYFPTTISKAKHVLALCSAVEPGITAKRCLSLPIAHGG